MNNKSKLEQLFILLLFSVGCILSLTRMGYGGMQTFHKSDEGSLYLQLISNSESSCVGDCEAKKDTGCVRCGAIHDSRGNAVMVGLYPIAGIVIGNDDRSGCRSSATCLGCTCDN